MEFIDTHTHIFLEQFDEDRKEVIARAVERGITTMLLPNIDHGTAKRMMDCYNQFPENTKPMIGLHPCSVGDGVEDELNFVENELGRQEYCAVGETGIDLYWDKSFLQKQLYSFRKQVRWAIEYDLPLVIHARESFSEIFQVIDEENDDRLKGVFHCFTGAKAEADKILSFGGFKMGLGGVLTYKNSGLAETVKDIDLAHFVLETDAPYLSPTPVRSKRNEPAHLIYVAEKLAEIKGENISHIAELTTHNAKQLFHL